MTWQYRGALMGGCTAVALAFAGAAPALAAPVDNHIQFGSNIWDDFSAESQEVDLNGNGLLDVGDTLRGIFTIENLNGNSSPPATPEVSGIFEIEVANKTSTGTPGFFDYTFAPHAGFATEFGGLPAGAMVAIFTDNDFDTVREGCAAGPGGSCEGNISDGTLAFVYGFGGDEDEAWEANGAPEDTSTGENFQVGDNLGTFAAALSVLENNSSKEITETSSVPFGLSTLFDGLGNDQVQIRLTGDIGGVSNLNDTDYDISNDADIEFNAIPAPATAALLGFGLMLMGFVARFVKA